MSHFKAKQRPKKKEFEIRYETLKHELKNAIRRGAVEAGKLLPTESELMKRSSLSRGSVRKLLTELENEGLIVRQQGRGSVVKECLVRERIKTDDVLVLSHSLVSFNYNKMTVPEFSYIRIAVFFEAIVNRLRKHNFRCHRINCSDYTNKELKDYLHKYKPLGAIVFFASSLELTSALPWLVDDGIPVISIGSSSAIPPEVITLSFDNIHMGTIAAEHLIQTGHKNIAGLACQTSLDWADTRMNAFVSYCRQRSVNPRIFKMQGDVSGYVGADSWLKMGYCLYEQVMDSFPEATAVFCINDLVAQGFIESAEKNKVSVPQYISVIGCGDDSLLFGHNVTTVSLEAYRIGIAAVDFLLKLAVEGASDITSAVINVNPCIINHDVSVAPPRGIL